MLSTRAVARDGEARLTATPAPFPAGHRIEAVVAHLQALGDLRGVIGIVEAWAEVGEPSPAARIAAARAFIQLGMMDRAWARIEPLTEANVYAREALEVAARAFIGRGWPSQARKAVERALVESPEDRALADLWESAVEPPTDADPGAIADDTDDDECIAAATRLVAHGAQHRARVLVERVLHRTPGHRRAADLQWALAGEFLPSGIDLVAVVSRHETLTALPEISDEPEQTESRVSPDALRALLEEADPQGAAAFPNLFRGLPQVHPQPDDAGEVTSAGAVFHPAPVPDVEDDPQPAEETQIRVVVDRAGVAAPLDSLAPFDLARFRADMGVDSEFLPAVEREDEDVVVHIRRAPAEPAVAAAATSSLDLEGRTDAGHQPPLPPESVDWVRPSSPKTEPSAPPRPRDASVARTDARWAVWAFALALVAAGLLGLVWLLVLLDLFGVL